MRETEIVTLTASDLWDLRGYWHKRCAEKNHNDMSLDELHHLAVCDALESAARCAESVGESGHVCDFTGRILDVVNLMPCNNDKTGEKR